jgi:hypothetical protein
MDSFDGITVRFPGLQIVGDMNAFDDQHVALFFNVTGRLGPEFTVGCVDLTRFQRASKGSGESPGGRRDEVVQRGGMGRFFVSIDPIVFRNFGVYTEGYRVVLGGKIGLTYGPVLPLDSYLRFIYNVFAHD